MNAIPYGRQDINQADIDAVVAVLRSDFLTQGPAVPAFEKAVADYCGAQHAVAVNSRRKRYREFLREGIPSGEWTLIRKAVKRGQLTGNSRFAEQVEQIVGRRIETRGAGRPVKDAREC
jgi:hypothetical protein